MALDSDTQQNESAQELVMTGASADEVWPLVRDYHYSKRMSAAIQHCFAVRRSGGLFGDTGEPVAAAIFGLPANTSWPNNALELQRLVRRDDYTAPLSQLLSFSLRWLRANTETPFVLSYADTGEGHHGGIYQASGWKYVRLAKGATILRDGQGKYIHPRTVVSKYGTWAREFISDKHPDWSYCKDSAKHLYIFPLRQKWSTISKQRGLTSKPYPKPHAARLLDDQGTPLNEAGANPAGRSNSSEVAV